MLNAVLGTATAWVLVRYRFPGRTALSALVDLPFAIPTLVAGMMLAVLYGQGSLIGASFAALGIELIFAPPGIVLALMFVTLPFVIRAVEPVLLEIDPAEEEAALVLGAGPWRAFRTVFLPAIAPAALSGAIRSLGRAMGEFGSIVVVAGNIPFKHADRAGLRLRRDRERRAAHRRPRCRWCCSRSRSCCTRSRASSRRAAERAMAELQQSARADAAARSCAQLTAAAPRRRRATPALPLGRLALLGVVLLYLGAVLLGPVLAIGVELADVGVGDALRALAAPEALAALRMSLVLTAISAVVNARGRHARRDRDRAPALPRPRADQRARRPAAGDLAGDDRPRVRAAGRPRRLARGAARGARPQGAVRVPGPRARHAVRDAAVHDARGRVRARGDRHERRRGRRHARRLAAGRPSGASRCRTSASASATAC